VLVRRADDDAVRERIGPGELELAAERNAVLAVVAEANRIGIVRRCAGDVELPLEREAAEQVRAATGTRAELHRVGVVNALPIRIERIEVQRRRRGRCCGPAVYGDRFT